MSPSTRKDVGANDASPNYAVTSSMHSLGRHQNDEPIDVNVNAVYKRAIVRKVPKKTARVTLIVRAICAIVAFLVARRAYVFGTLKVRWKSVRSTTACSTRPGRASLLIVTNFSA